MAYDPTPLTASQVESKTFGTSLRGYRPEDVDAMMATISETLNGHESGIHSVRQTITADQVATGVFRTGLRGYDLNEVDDFLDYVVATLRHHESGGRSSADHKGESTPQMGTRSNPFKRRVTLSSRATSPRPSPSVDPDPESDSARSASIPDEEVVEEFRPRSSEELLDQAKKWLDRS